MTGAGSEIPEDVSAPPAAGREASAPALRTSAKLENLAERARDYAEASSSENTRRAYAADWRHYSGWTRRHGLPAVPPDSQVVGLYISACASGALTGYAPLHAAHADLLERAGLAAEASAAWARAERAMGNAALQRELHRRRAAAAGSE